MIKWHIGCSGFHYNDWKGKFYPEDLPKNKWFDYYSERFNSIELNVTFYRFPRLENLQNWYNKSPRDFSFSVKAPRYITHYRKFVNTKSQLSDFYNTIKPGLKKKLGCVLFQFPSIFVYNEEKLRLILNSLDKKFQNVLEFRHESWWKESVYQDLSENHVTFCSMSHPDLPDNVIINGPVVYYRYHGVPHLYRSEYSLKKLRQVSDKIKNSKKVKEAFIYFNNDYDAVGVKNARQMQRLAMSNEQ